MQRIQDAFAGARNRHRRADRSRVEGDRRRRGVDAVVRRNGDASSPALAARSKSRGADAEKGRSQIEVWEPNRTLRVALRPFDGACRCRPDRSSTNTRSSRKTARPCCAWSARASPRRADWDGFYDGTNSGWPSFFRALRHYLEHHRGKPRQVIKLVGMLPGSLEEAWANLTGPERIQLHAGLG